MGNDMDRPASLDEWIALLKERPLPLLQNTRDSLRRLDLDNVSMARFSNIALTDPGLTLTILRAAAQKPSKRLSGEILTLDVAAMILGMAAMTTLFEQMGLLEECVEPHTKELYMQLVSRTYHGAYQAYGMARIRVDIVPEEIFTAAMLQEVGALMLLVHGGGVLGREIMESEERQLAVLGCTLNQLSQGLAREWRLSSFIQRSLDSEAALNNPRLNEIRLASSVAHAAERGWEGEEMEQLIEAMARHLHIDIADALGEIRDTAIQSAGETPFYGVMPAAASLPGLSEDERARLEPAINAATAAAASRVTPPAAATAAPPVAVAPASATPRERMAPPATPPAAAPTPPPRRAPMPLQATVDLKTRRNDEALAGAIRELEQLLTGSVHLPNFMALLKIAFHDALGLNRAFFAMLSPDRKYLVSRFVFGHEQGLRNLRIPVGHGNLFQRLLEKPQAIWVKEENRQKVLPLLPMEVYKLFDTADFFLMTIRVKGKPLGVVYGDRKGGEQLLDEVDYEKFRQLGLLLAKGFEQLGR